MRLYKGEYANGGTAIFAEIERGEYDVVSVYLTPLLPNYYYFDSNNYSEYEQEVAKKLDAVKVGERASGFCKYNLYEIPLEKFIKIKELK